MKFIDGEILQGNVLEVLKAVPEKSVHCVVTSPPYWGLRSYGNGDCDFVWTDADEHIQTQIDCEHDFNIDTKVGDIRFRGENAQVGNNKNPDVHKGNGKGTFCSRCGAWRGQLGLEPTPEMFVEHVVQIFREVRRVLRDDGVLWLNLGDSYWGNGVQKKDEHGQARTNTGLKNLDKIGIPWRVALALQEDGWYLRQDVIWSKPNPMPESINGWRWEQHRVKTEKGKISRRGDPAETGIRSAHGTYPHNESESLLAKWQDCPGCPKCEKNNGLIFRKGSWRPTTAHEYIFMLAKTDNYFCDAEATREPHKYDGRKDTKLKGSEKYKDSGHTFHERGHERWPNPAGKNKRSVWEIPTHPCPEAHFATFPPALVEPCIKASTSEKGCCVKCGAPWVRIRKPSEKYKKHLGKTWTPDTDRDQNLRKEIGFAANGKTYSGTPEYVTVGWKATCDCGVGVERCVVLDPFMGAGTVGLVARSLGCRFLGVEAVAEYIEIAKKRIDKTEGILSGV